MLPSMHIGQAFSFVDLTGTDQITEAEAEVGFGWFWYIMHWNHKIYKKYMHIKYKSLTLINKDKIEEYYHTCMHA